jgi:hypothetical protein
MSRLKKIAMVEGFWSHPDFTLEMALYAFVWALQWDTARHDITTIEEVASDRYLHDRLYAVWWLDVSVLWETEENIPFAIPGGFTEFQFRSYQPVNGEYEVTWVDTPHVHETCFPVGTIVYVRR